jgi:hypothetical protein
VVKKPGADGEMGADIAEFEDGRHEGEGKMENEKMRNGE